MARIRFCLMAEARIISTLTARSFSRRLLRAADSALPLRQFPKRNRDRLLPEALRRAEVILGALGEHKSRMGAGWSGVEGDQMRSGRSASRSVGAALILTLLFAGCGDGGGSDSPGYKPATVSIHCLTVNGTPVAVGTPCPPTPKTIAVSTPTATPSATLLPSSTPTPIPTPTRQVITYQLTEGSTILCAAVSLGWVR